MPSKTELAWTAGMIDADGCVTLNGSKKEKGGLKKPLVVVDNTDREILEALLELHGGGKLVKKKKAALHHRQAWSWRLYGADRIADFLKSVLPFMRCQSKRRRAEMIVNGYKLVTPRNGFYTPAGRLARHAWQAEFMAIGEGRGSQCKKADT